jgi:hypothetical protein
MRSGCGFFFLIFLIATAATILGMFLYEVFVKGYATGERMISAGTQRLNNYKPRDRQVSEV